MNSAKKFWALIVGMIVAGIIYMKAAGKVINRIMKRRRV